MGLKTFFQVRAKRFVFSKSLVVALLIGTAASQTVTLHAQVVQPPIVSAKERASAKGFVAYEQGKVAQSLYWFKKAATLGDNGAGYNIATMVLRGETRAVNQKQALAYLLQSGYANFGLAQFMLGTLYENGTWVARSKQTSFEWYLKAANNQQADAYQAVGTAYYLGFGTSQNYSQALQWLEKSANTGDSGAQYLVASMYESGLGTGVNLENALSWYSLCARQGDLSAQIKAKELAAKIADQQKDKP